MDLNNPIFNTLFNAASEGMYFVDRNRRILAWNDASERITGFSRQQVIGELCMSNLLMHCDDTGRRLCLDGCPLAATLFDAKQRTAQVYLRHAAGHRVPVQVRVYPIENGGEVTGALEIFSHITTLESATERLHALERAAMLDPLTGVASRRAGQARLESALEEWRRNAIPFGVLMADIDHFKQFNDTFGHATGDRVLAMVACSLASSLRPYDLVVRWGGEEFLILVTNVSREGVARVGERARMLVEASELFLSDDDRAAGRGLRVTVSIGTAYARPGDDLPSMLERADQNLYISKRAGRNRLTVE